MFGWISKSSATKVRNNKNGTTTTYNKTTKGTWKSNKSWASAKPQKT